MTDLKLIDNGDGTYGDLEDINGELSTVSAAAEGETDEEVLQRIWIALNTGLGEWAFDTSFGFPYRQIIGERGVDKTFIEGKVRTTIERTTGNKSVQDIQIALEPITQKLTIAAHTIYGTVMVTT